MFVEEVSYQVSKFLRRAKITINRIDQAQVLRTVGILVITFAVLGTSPPKSKTLGTEAGSSRVEDGEEARSSKLDESSLQPPAPVPASSFQPPVSVATVPTVSAQAAYIIDSQTDTVLYEKNPDQRLPMASLTKIMTALVVLENFKLDEIVTVPKACANLPPNEMGLVPNEKISVENLLYGTLVVSGSDAACALSHHFNGDFLELMNQKARELGLYQTHFENEVGLDGENGNHLSTAKDLVKLSKAALESGVFRKIVGTAQWQGLTSTNELLLTLPGMTGVKTGYTEQAKGCLAASYERDGREIIGVILGSDDRFADMQEILKWIFKVYQWP